MQQLKKIYRYVNILSFDVSAGAVIGSLFFADFFRTTPSINGTLCLAISVWVIYTLDHLLDAYRMKGTPVTERHLFHYRNFRVLACILGVVALIDVGLILTLPFSMFRSGMILGILVGFYLLFINRFAVIKEPLAAAMYCMGVLIPIEGAGAWAVNDMMLIGQFFMVALMNLLLFSWFDFPKDQVQGTRSGVLVLGRSRTAVFLWLLFGLNSVILIVAASDLHFFLLWCIALGNMILFIFPREVAEREDFRLIGDGLFLLPVLSLL